MANDPAWQWRSGDYIDKGYFVNDSEWWQNNPT